MSLFGWSSRYSSRWCRSRKSLHSPSFISHSCIRSWWGRLQWSDPPCTRSLWCWRHGNHSSCLNRTRIIDRTWWWLWCVSSWSLSLELRKRNARYSFLQSSTLYCKPLLQCWSLKARNLGAATADNLRVDINQLDVKSRWLSVFPNHVLWRARFFSLHNGSLEPNRPHTREMFYTYVDCGIAPLLLTPPMWLAL